MVRSFNSILVPELMAGNCWECRRCEHPVVFMRQALTAAECNGDTVTAASAAADTTYISEGYIVGPAGKSLTLGTGNNTTTKSSQTPTSAYGVFRANTNDASLPQSKPSHREV